MARKKIFGTAFYKSGTVMNVLDIADVKCYQAGTTTGIPMYSTKTGGIPFWPSPPGAGLQTDTNGYFQFWIEYEDLIKVEITKFGYSPIVRDHIGTVPADMIIYGGQF